jgi:hypothetical protein
MPPDLKTEIETILSKFLETNPERFDSQTKDVPGRIMINLQASSSYFGIWIPKAFPSLMQLFRKLMKLNRLILQQYEFSKWREQIFHMRLDIDLLAIFQVENSPVIELPPTFLITKAGIEQHLLYSALELNNPSFADLQQLVLAALPQNLAKFLDSVPRELELILLSLVESMTYRQKNNLPTLSSIQTMLAGIPPTFAKIIFLNSILVGLKHQVQYSDQIIKEVSLSMEEYELPMIRILSLRILAKYHEQLGNLSYAETYYKFLMDESPLHSWSKPRDLITANIGLSRIYAQKGDYFRALTFYSFAQQGFSQLGDAELVHRSEQEMQRIALLSATQLLQTGLYSINNGDLSNNAILTLLDGYMSGLHLLVHPIQLDRHQFLLFLGPLLNACANLMVSHLDRVNQLFEFSLEPQLILNVTLAVCKLDPQQEDIQAGQQLYDLLSFKDQKLVEKISVFYQDGRHIGDYELRDQRIVKAQSNADQTLFSSAMASVGMLISEATQSEGGVDEISVGNKAVIFNSGEFITFALIAKSSSPNIKSVLNQIKNVVECDFHETLIKWDGGLHHFNALTQYLGPLNIFCIDKST